MFGVWKQLKHFRCCVAILLGKGWMGSNTFELENQKSGYKCSLCEKVEWCVEFGTLE